MRYNSETLLDELQGHVRELILEANRLLHLSREVLQQSPGPGRWSVAQVMEHLNFYNRHYVPAIRSKLQGHGTSPSTGFRPGWLGDYFTKLMQPGENGTVAKKMKAPNNAVPAAQPDGHAQIRAFIDHQQQLLNLLEDAKSANISSIRVPTSLSRFIALKLGDTFRFFIAHEQRHFVQVRRVLEDLHAD